MKHKKIISVMLSIFLLMSAFPAAVFAEDSETTVTVQSVTAAAGTTVDVPVVVQNNPGILGATLKFTYDPGLTLQSITNGNAFSSLTMTKPGVFTSPFKVTWDGQDIDEDDIKDGNILILQFAVPNDAAEGTIYNISASYEDSDFVDYNLDPIDLTVTNGTITVVNIKYGDLDGNELVNTTDVIRMRRHIAGGYSQTINELAADVNLDTSINTTDVIILRRYIAGGYGIDELPYVVHKHELVHHAAKAATETEDGNKEYWECSRCHKYFKDDEGSTAITWDEIVIPQLVKSEYSIQYMCDMVPIDANRNPQYIPDDVYQPTKAKVLPTPKMDTYKFLGWSDKNGRMFGPEIPEGTTGDLILYANWASDRNKAEPVASLGDPIICEDSDNGQILFVYEIGKIKNIPLFETQDLLVVNGVITSTGIVKQRSIAKGNAEEIGKTIANTTTNSATWTLSKDWNETTSVSEEWAQQQGMSQEQAEEFCKTNSNSYSLTNSSGGSESLINNDSSSYRYSANDAHVRNTYSEEQRYAGLNVNGKVSNSTTASLGVNAGLTIPLCGVPVGIGAEAGLSNTFAWEVGASYDQQKFTKDIKSGTDSWGKSIDLAGSKSTTSTSEKTWNTTEGYSSSTSTSSKTAVSKVVSELISQKHSTDSTYSTGGSSGEAKEYASSNAQEDKYSSSVTFSEEEIQISERTFSSTGNTYGSYRLVEVGMARVFAVVGYDIKNKAYYTYTYSVLDDDEYKEYLDYSYDRTFSDYETSTLPFEIPGFVNDYVNSRIATSKLQINDNGIVTKYLGDADDEIVLIPSYYTKNNATTGEPELHKIKGIAPGLFKNNTSIIGVSLGNFVNEIPESAFEGCTALKEVICPNVVRIEANAFKDCSSLSEFSIPDEIEYIGENAFDGTNSIKANAPTKEIANIIANSNVQNITLDISKINASDFSDMSLDIGEIESFKVLGGRKEYKGLSIKSDAQNTIISGVTISGGNKIPIEVSSPNLTLERVTAQSDGFALVLKADETIVSLEGVSGMISSSANSIIAKSINFVQLNDETYSAVESSGNVLVCGDVSNNEGYIADDKIVFITEEEYDNYLTSRKVTFDANGGTMNADPVMIPYNGTFGELPIASRDYYTFDGWYTEPEDGEGEEITAESIMTSLVDMTLYAHWTHNEAIWALAEDVPDDAERIDSYYKYDLTSYTSTGSSSLDGWTPYGTPQRTGWGSTQGPVYSDPGNGSRNVWSERYESSRTHHYKYYHKYGYYNNNGTWQYCWSKDAWASTGARHTIDITYPLSSYYSSSFSDTCYKSYTCPHGCGTSTIWFYDGEYDDVQYGTRWYYQDPVYTYYYKKTQTDKESASYPSYALLSSVSESNHPTGDYMSNVREYVQYRTK